MSPVDGDDVAGDVSPGPDSEPHAHGAGEPDEQPPACYFGSLGEFAGWLLEVYRRSTRGQARVFCPQWWKHPEAIARMDALWRAFEQLRQDPGTGMSVFWRDHVDHHMSVMLDADGPFKGCEDGHSEHPLEPIAPAAARGAVPSDERGLPPSQRRAASWRPRAVAAAAPAAARHDAQTVDQQGAANGRRARTRRHWRVRSKTCCERESCSARGWRNATPAPASEALRDAARRSLADARAERDHQRARPASRALTTRAGVQPTAGGNTPPLRTFVGVDGRPQLPERGRARRARRVEDRRRASKTATASTPSRSTPPRSALAPS